MGTNFYMHTKNKNLAEKYAPYSYELTDTPDWGYQFHVAKTSYGWLPLFQAHEHGIQSVIEYKEAYDTGVVQIFDEYGQEYNWDEFDERVLKFNGGVVGAIEPIRIYNTQPELYDECIPEYTPISHIPGTKQSYNYRYAQGCKTMFKDGKGYEFEEVDFS